MAITKYKIIFFLLLELFLFTKVFAQPRPCTNCEPLAEVAISNKGLCKILHLSIQQNLAEFNSMVHSRAGFRDITLDRSNCATLTASDVLNQSHAIPKYEKEMKNLEAAYQNNPKPEYKQNWEALAHKVKSLKESCIGLPELTSDYNIGGKTQIRPFTGTISDFRRNEMDLDLAEGPICENLNAKFKIRVKKLAISGNMKVDYTDKNENFIPNTKLVLSTTDQADIVLAAEANLDPKTGHLNELVSLDSSAAKINIKPGSFNVQMNYKKNFDSPEQERTLQAKHYRKQISSLNKQLTDPTYVDKQIATYIASVAFRDWATNGKKEPYEEAEKRALEKLNANYGSRDQLRQKLLSTAWPDLTNDAKVAEFMKNPPAEVGFFSEVSDRIDAARIATIAENAGFSNAQSFELAMIGVYAANRAQESSTMMKDVIVPMLEKEIIPAAVREANVVLRDLKSYWDKIAQVPALNLQNYQNLDLLKGQLSKAKTNEEREKLSNAISTLQDKIAKDWIPIETMVLIDRNTQGQKLLRGLISSNKPECSSYPKAFSDDQDDNFDVRTELGVPAIQEYFNKMHENRKMSVCLDSSSTDDCKDGTQIDLKKPVNVRCENGKIVLEADASVKKSIFGADIAGNINAEVGNCNGHPCFKLTDSSGKFKNVFVNAFFGKMLDRTLAAAVDQNSTQRFEVPKASLLNAQPGKTNCSTKLDWGLKP